MSCVSNARLSGQTPSADLYTAATMILKSAGCDEFGRSGDEKKEAYRNALARHKLAQLASHRRPGLPGSYQDPVLCFEA